MSELLAASGLSKTLASDSAGHSFVYDSATSKLTPVAISDGKIYYRDELTQGERLPDPTSALVGPPAPLAGPGALVGPPAPSSALEINSSPYTGSSGLPMTDGDLAVARGISEKLYQDYRAALSAQENQVDYTPLILAAVAAFIFFK
jgi:hypothetical protein